MRCIVQLSVLKKAEDKVLDEKLEATWRIKPKLRGKWGKLSNWVENKGRARWACELT